MYELTKDSVIDLRDEERKAIFERVYEKPDKNYHYLAFDRQFGGYSPLNVYVTNHDASIMRDEKDIFETRYADLRGCLAADDSPVENRHRSQPYG